MNPFTSQQLEFAEPLMFEINSGSYDPKSGNLLSWPYYDRLPLTASATQYNFFVEGAGGVNNKTFSDTNFQGGGQMGSNEAIRIEEINLYWTPEAVLSQANYLIFMAALANSYFQMGLQGKSPSIQMPLDLFMGDPMPLIVNTGTAGDQLTTRTKKVGSKRLEIPIILQAKANFTCTINFDAAPNAALVGDLVMIEFWGRKISL